MAKLYELTAAYSQLESMIDDAETQDEQVTKWLDECTGALREKATDIAQLIGNIESTADAIKAAEQRMAARRKALENRATWIKGYLLRNMQAAEIMSIECPLFVIKRQKNPPRVVIDDEAAIPIYYLRQPEPPPPVPDKKAILEDIKQGVIIDGAHMEQDERLVMK